MISNCLATVRLSVCDFGRRAVVDGAGVRKCIKANDKGRVDHNVELVWQVSQFTRMRRYPKISP